MEIRNTFIVGFGLLADMASVAEIEPNWESMAANSQVPEWFQDAKQGVWMHWGILLQDLLRKACWRSRSIE